MVWQSVERILQTVAKPVAIAIGYWAFRNDKIESKEMVDASIRISMILYAY